jgi:hypothetical protein
MIPGKLHQSTVAAKDSSLERKARRIPVLGAVFPNDV